MAYTITPLTEHTGAEVRGLDLTKPIDAETRTALNRAFARHHVLAVRDQKYEPGDFLQAVQLWGELQPHDKKEMHVPGWPQMYYVSNEQTVPGKRYISGKPGMWWSFLSCGCNSPQICTARIKSAGSYFWSRTTST
jgi:alpha-ketoglutarate-dependent taurine dioxygenase